jgi:membrane protein
VGAQSAFHFVEQQLTLLFGTDTAQVLVEAVRASQEYEGYLATVISIATLLVGATTVLAALEQALNRIWGTDPEATRGIRAWVRRRVLSLGFILALSFLLLVTLSVSTMVAGMRSWLAERHAPLLGFLGMLDLLVSVGITTSLFALIYRYMPGHRLRWRTVLVGGLVTALLFALGKWLVGLYLARSTVPNAFGAAASFAALLLWLYYTSQIFLFGAEFTACLGGLDGRPPAARHPERTSPRGRLGRSGKGQ